MVWAVTLMPTLYPAFPSASTSGLQPPREAPEGLRRQVDGIRPGIWHGTQPHRGRGLRRGPPRLCHVTRAGPPGRHAPGGQGRAWALCGEGRRRGKSRRGQRRRRRRARQGQGGGMNLEHSQDEQHAALSKIIDNEE